jgi:hypothetical protein
LDKHQRKVSPGTPTLGRQTFSQIKPSPKKEALPTRTDMTFIQKHIPTLYKILPKQIERVVVKHYIDRDVYIKDSNGLIKEDLVRLKLAIPNKPFNTSDTLSDVAYKAGQQSVITYIENLIERK